ncbi:MAG: hypothetical protein WA614_02880 [Acidimicrobiales bacterium]
MRVVVVGDITHVVIDRPGGLFELFVSDTSERVVKVTPDVVGWIGIVHAPHDHGHETYFAVADPARLVFEVALRDDRRLAQLARPAHCTCKMTWDL